MKFNFHKMSGLDFKDLDKVLQQQNGRIIHQVWFGTIPNKRAAKKAYDKMKIYRDSWKIHNPTWFHIEWNKPLCKLFVKTFFPEHVDMFSRYKHEIQRCDAVRYLLLYRYGGIYADMDYYCNKPFDEALQKFTNDIYFVQSPNKSLFQDSDHISNSLMYSKPNHPFWKRVMIELEINKRAPYYYTKHLEVMFTTGPGLLNKIYSKYKYRYNVKSLPFKLFHPYGIGDEKIDLNNKLNVYAIHIGKGSWESKDSKILLTIVREWQIILFIVIFYIILYMYIKYK